MTQLELKTVDIGSKSRVNVNELIEIKPHSLCKEVRIIMGRLITLAARLPLAMFILCF